MSNLIQLQGGYKSFAAKKIFEDAQFAVNEGEHVGVIGPNGAGKTTLFKILVGQEELDSGQFTKMKELRIGYLAQHDQFSPGQSVEDFLAQDSRLPIWELKTIGRKLGLQEEQYGLPILSLSGGYRMRCKLLQLLGQEPQLMLLDEPTNYLDLETTLVLENFLQGYRGAFLLISHDREFLRRTTDHVLEVEQGQITKYNGNIDDYFEQKELIRTQLEARAESLQDKRDRILDFVNRFGAKATKARQAQSRLKSLQKMEVIEVKSLPVKAVIKIPTPVHTGKQIVSVNSVDLGYGSKIVLKDIHFQVNRGDHLAVVGLNGAGKSTFLKALAGKLAPLKGSIELGFQVQIGYYAQHVAESLMARSTVFEEMARVAHSDVTQQEILNLAGALLFSGEDVRKSISVLSGGEKARVALGQVLLQKLPCLILDEPTNHLDFQTVEALTQSLQSFDGTLIVVSHDRGFTGRIGQKILEIKNGQALLYPGSYDDYVWSFEKGVLAEVSNEVVKDNAVKIQNISNLSESVSQKLNPRELKKTQDKIIRQLEGQVRDLERKMAMLDEQIRGINQRISEGATDNLRQSVTELGASQLELSRFEEEWILLHEKLEQEKIKIP